MLEVAAAEPTLQVPRDPDPNGSLGPVAVAPAPEVGGLSPEDRELKRRLVWLAAFRIAAVTVLVGTTAVIVFKGGEPLGGRASATLSALAVGTNLLQIGIFLLLRLDRALRQLALVQILGDVAFAAALVYLTGGPDSLFTFLFLLSIVNGGILLSRRGAWFAAAAAYAIDTVILLGLHYGVLPAAEGVFLERYTWAELYQTLFTHGAAFGLTAVLASYAAQQLRSADRRAGIAESNLIKLGALHDAIVRSIASGIVTTDESDRITFVNRAGEEILGCSAESLRGFPLDGIFPPLTDVLERRAAVLQRLECTWLRPDGETRILGFTIAPLIDETGRRIGSSAVFSDLTQVRELQTRAARSEKLAAVGELAAGLAHEIRNPLASMSGSIELLQLGGDRPADEARLLDIVQREAGRLNALVGDFLSFARPGLPKLEPVALPDLVEEVLLAFRATPQGGGVELRDELAPASVRGDANQLKQVLWNLLLNAVQASRPGGMVRISTGPGSAPGTACLRIEDFGVGIEREALERIFDPFFTTKDRGTGLGLSVVHRIVEAHRGHVGVTSRLGEGTQFTIVLPAAEARK